MGVRGQTQLDFLVGTTILLLTIIGAILFVQTSVFQTFDTTDSGTRNAQADRVATHLVENYSTDGNRTVLRYNQSNGIATQLNRDSNLTDLRNKAGVNVTSSRRVSPNLNVMIVNGTSLAEPRDRPAVNATGEPLTWGDSYDGESGVATAVRVIRLQSDEGQAGTSDICDPVCWLEVRVW